MKAHEIREMTDDDIRIRLSDLKEEYFKLSFRNAVHRVDNPLQLRELRREIARCMTIVNERESNKTVTA